MKNSRVSYEKSKIVSVSDNNKKERKKEAWMRIHLAHVYIWDQSLSMRQYVFNCSTYDANRVCIIDQDYNVQTRGHWNKQLWSHRIHITKYWSWKKIVACYDLKIFSQCRFCHKSTKSRCIIIRFIIVYSCVNGLRACHCFVMSRDLKGGDSRQTSRNNKRFL